MQVLGLRRLNIRALRIVFIVFAVLAMGMLLAPLTSRGEGLNAPALVVATDKMRGGWRGTVLLAAPLGEVHVGIILNRPTKFKMSELFPSHEPSKAVVDPVYLGGPAQSDSIFALVRSSSAPHPRSFELSPGVWLVFDGPTVDRVIEATPNDARYFVGMVMWGAGELAEEVRRGLMVLRPVDAGKLFLQDTSKLHQQLAPKPGETQI